MLGGRVAEELEFNDISTGARDDINRATILARKMACEWGMSEKLGPLSLGKQDEEIFLGREMGLHRNFSEETAKLIDSEIRRFVEEAHREAHRLLQDNVKKLKALAQKLLEKEILDTAEIDEIIGIVKPSVAEVS
jgi:cell division protease FtsH